jgi:excisionase family DNA binding protein
MQATEDITMTDPTEWLTVEEIAAELKLKPKTVRDFVQRGEFPATKVGRVYRIRRSDLTDWLRSKEVNAPRRPSRFTASEMERWGVEIVDEETTRLRCMSCGQSWSPNIQPGGRLPNRYWQCPNGCNTPEV